MMHCDVSLTLSVDLRPHRACDVHMLIRRHTSPFGQIVPSFADFGRVRSGSPDGLGFAPANSPIPGT